MEKGNEENIVYAKNNMYDSIFNQEFNKSFFKPKKDLCIICEAYKNKTGADIDNVTEIYDIHHKKKSCLERLSKKICLETLKKITFLKKATLCVAFIYKRF